jgi:hypothetical protein
MLDASLLAALSINHTVPFASSGNRLPSCYVGCIIHSQKGSVRNNINVSTLLSIMQPVSTLSLSFLKYR